MSMSSNSSAVMMWFRVWKWHPGWSLIYWSDLIWIGEGVSTLGQMWLVEIVPFKCTTTVVKYENLFHGITDGGVASLLDGIFVGHEEWAHAGLGEIGLEDIPPFAKESLPHFDAILWVRRGEHLVGFRVANGNETVLADILHNRNVWREVEVYGRGMNS